MTKKQRNIFEEMAETSALAIIDARGYSKEKTKCLKENLDYVLDDCFDWNDSLSLYTLNMNLESLSALYDFIKKSNLNCTVRYLDRVANDYENNDELFDKLKDYVRKNKIEALDWVFA